MLSPRLEILLRQAAVLTLAVYWIALFTGTHIPIPQSVNLENSDKWIHFLAYTGLAAQLTVVVGWRARRGLQAWHLAMIGLGLAAFGGFDELTQMLVNRTADWLDWSADLGGIFTGIAIGAIAVRLLGLGRCEANGAGEIADGEAN